MRLFTKFQGRDGGDAARHPLPGLFEPLTIALKMADL